MSTGIQPCLLWYTIFANMIRSDHVIKHRERVYIEGIVDIVFTILYIDAHVAMNW